MGEKETKTEERLGKISQNLEDINKTIKDIFAKPKELEKKEKDFDTLLSFVDAENRVKDWKHIPWITKFLTYLPRVSYLIMTVFFFFIFYLVIVVLLPVVTIDNLLVALLAIIAIVLQIISVLNDLSKTDNIEPKISTVVEWNYKRLKGDSPVKDNLPLLKALILLKVTETNFSLVEMNKKYPKVINEENVMAKLYDLSKN
jgi:hypothetical protein